MQHSLAITGPIEVVKEVKEKLLIQLRRIDTHEEDLDIEMAEMLDIPAVKGPINQAVMQAKSNLHWKIDNETIPKSQPKAKVHIYFFSEGTGNMKVALGNVLWVIN